MRLRYNLYIFHSLNYWKFLGFRFLSFFPSGICKGTKLLPSKMEPLMKIFNPCKNSFLMAQIWRLQMQLCFNNRKHFVGIIIWTRVNNTKTKTQGTSFSTQKAFHSTETWSVTSCVVWCRVSGSLAHKSLLFKDKPMNPWQKRNIQAHL